MILNVSPSDQAVISLNSVHRNYIWHSSSPKKSSSLVQCRVSERMFAISCIAHGNTAMRPCIGSCPTYNSSPRRPKSSGVWAEWGFFTSSAPPFTPFSSAWIGLSWTAWHECRNASVVERHSKDNKWLPLNISHLSILKERKSKWMTKM